MNIGISGCTLGGNVKKFSDIRWLLTGKEQDQHSPLSESAKGSSAVSLPLVASLLDLSNECKAHLRRTLWGFLRYLYVASCQSNLHAWL